MTVCAQPPAAATRMPVWTLSLLAATAFAAITTEVLPVGLLPDISHSLGTSESRAGLLVSAYAIVVAVGSIPLAALAARWPRRRVLCATLAIYALSNAVMASTDDYWIALGTRLLGGLAHAGFFSAAFAAAISIAPPGKAGRAVAFVGAGNALGLAIGVPLGTALGTAAGWRWAFAGCAGIMLLLAVLTAAILPAAQSPSSHSAHISVLTAIRGRHILMVAAVVVVLTLGHYTPYTYISPLLLHAGVSTDGISLVLFGYGTAGIAGVLLASTVVDRRPRLWLGVAIVLTAACLLSLGLVRATAPAVMLVIVWGLAFGTLTTLIQGVALRAVPHAPDAAPAVVNAAFNVGIAGGAFIGARELLIAAPPVLALTGAALAAASLPLLLSARPARDLRDPRGR